MSQHHSLPIANQMRRGMQRMAKNRKRSESLKKTAEPRVTPGLGGLLRIYQEQAKADVSQLTDTVNVGRALPLASFLVMESTEDERRWFDWDDAKVRESADFLAWLLARVEDETLRAAIDDTIGKMVSALVNQGRYVPPENIVQRHLKKAQVRAHCDFMNIAQTKSAEAKKETLYPLIEAEAEALGVARLPISREFAGRLRPGVRKRLGLTPDDDGWPTISMILTCVRTIRARDK